MIILDGNNCPCSWTRYDSSNYFRRNLALPRIIQIWRAFIGHKQATDLKVTAPKNEDERELSRRASELDENGLLQPNPEV